MGEDPVWEVLIMNGLEQEGCKWSTCCLSFDWAPRQDTCFIRKNNEIKRYLHY